MQLSVENNYKIDYLVYNELARLGAITGCESILGRSGKTKDQIGQSIKTIIENNDGEVNFEYSVPWLTQVLLKKGVQTSDLRIDNPKQTIYPVHAHEYLPITSISTLNYLITYLPDAWVFSWFVRNMDHIRESLDLMQSSIQEKRDILIVSNHATWFNLPLIAHCLHRFFQIPKENIYTILGPAITHSYWNLAGITRYSNAIKTYPDTKKAQTGYQGSQEIQERFLIQLKEIFSSKNTTNTSRILLLSPSGTTDTIVSKNEIIMKQPSPGTEVLIQMLLRRMNMLGFTIGVNDTNILPAGNSRPVSGKVYVSTESVNSRNWKARLPDCIINQSGSSIGKWEK